MPVNKRILTPLVCAAATLATMSVAHSQLGVQALRRSGAAFQDSGSALSVSTSSADATKRLVASLKASGAAYDLEVRDAKGKLTRFRNGRIPTPVAALLVDFYRKWPGIPGINDKRTCVNMVFGGYKIDQIQEILKGVQSRVIQVEVMQGAH